MKRVLIVEDEIAYVKLLKEKLSSECEVFVAENGKKGLEVAEKEKPDLILCDISMPVMDGMTMLKELRAQPFGQDVKVVMLTNLEPTQDIVKKAATDHPSLYVVKSDISLSELLEKIRKLLAGT